MFEAISSSFKKILDDFSKYTSKRLMQLKIGNQSYSNQSSSDLSDIVAEFLKTIERINPKLKLCVERRKQFEVQKKQKFANTIPKI